MQSDLARATHILTREGDLIDVREFARSCIERENIKILEFVHNGQSGYSVRIRVGNNGHEYMGKLLKSGDLYMETIIPGIDKPILSYIGMFENMVIN